MKMLLVLVLIVFIEWVQSEAFNVQPVVVPKYKLSLCTMVRNEGWYLEEWIAYHLLLRVDHFYIYNDEGTDTTAEVLKPYIKRGIVSLIPWNHTIKTVDPELVPINPAFTRRQRFAIADCLFHHQHESEYFGVWDMDEFAVLNYSFATIPDFLRYNDQFKDDYEIPITVFGSSGFNETPEGLVIDNFRTRSKFTIFGLNPDDNKFSGKSLYKSGCGRPNVHFSPDLAIIPEYECRKKTRGWFIEEGSRAHTPLSLNHYAVKSWEHFISKTKKWHFGLNKTQFDAQLATSNNYRDETLVKFVIPVKELMQCMASTYKFQL